MVDERGWCRRVQVWAGRQFLCWTALWPSRCPPQGAACVDSTPASCYTPPEPAAPPVPARQACPLESRVMTTQLSSVCVCRVDFLCVCALTLLLSLWDSLRIKKAIHFYDPNKSHSRIAKKKEKKGKRKLLLQIRISWTQEHFESHRLSAQMFGILPRHWLCFLAITTKPTETINKSKSTQYPEAKYQTELTGGLGSIWTDCVWGRLPRNKVCVALENTRQCNLEHCVLF